MIKRYLKKRFGRFQNNDDDYAHEMVTAARAYEIAAEVMRPDEMGLTGLKPGYHAANPACDIVHLLQLFPTKGASYQVRWGLSLAYVPHKWNPKLHWHRTLKSARFDIWENAIEYFELEGKRRREWETFLISKLRGQTCLRKQMNEMWVKLAPAVREWFRKTVTLSGALWAIEKQIQRPGASSHHAPPPMLVRAFTLSRIGELEEARMVLETYLHNSNADNVERENLSAALESVVAN